MVGFVYESGGWECSFDARYSFQSAVDVTPDSYSFGERIPYVSKHSVVLDASVAWKGFELSPRWILRSGRYDSSGELPDWNTLDLTLSRKFALPALTDLTVYVSGRNLSDCRYELVTGYPMPGRSFIAGIALSF